MTDTAAYPSCKHGRKIYERCTECEADMKAGIHGGFERAAPSSKDESLDNAIEYYSRHAGHAGMTFINTPTLLDTLALLRQLKQYREIVGYEIDADSRVETTAAPLKGVFEGECNRTACRTRPATWYSEVEKAHYCEPCAVEINKWVPPTVSRLVRIHPNSGTLRESLRIYGGHIPPCPGRPCTCGFQQAWDAAGLTAPLQVKTEAKHPPCVFRDGCPDEPKCTDLCRGPL